MKRFKSETSFGNLDKLLDEEIENNIKSNVKNLVLEKSKGDVALSLNGTSPGFSSNFCENFNEGKKNFPVRQTNNDSILKI